MKKLIALILFVILASTAKGQIITTIAGGFTNTGSGYASSIVGGKCNTMCSGSKFSTVVGGRLNSIKGCNTTVVGGESNIATGDFSAILGGCNNNDNGHAYAGIFGCNITAVAANTFHVANAWACCNVCVLGVCVTIPAMQGSTASLPLGTLYYQMVGGLCQVFIV